MHDLTKAMLAAAESQRTMTLSQLQADSKAYTEEIHGRSAGLASDLRKRADDDVAGIREWQKAEIARVKEETDQRISGRKGELETQLETHAAVIEQADVRRRQWVPQRARQVKLDAQQVLRHAVAGRRHRGRGGDVGRGGRSQHGSATRAAGECAHGAERAASSG